MTTRRDDVLKFAETDSPVIQMAGHDILLWRNYCEQMQMTGRTHPVSAMDFACLKAYLQKHASKGHDIQAWYETLDSYNILTPAQRHELQDSYVILLARSSCHSLGFRTAFRIACMPEDYARHARAVLLSILPHRKPEEAASIVSRMEEAHGKLDYKGCEKRVALFRETLQAAKAIVSPSVP